MELFLKGMLVSVSADHNLEDFDWYTFGGAKAVTLKGYNQRHDFRLEKGDVYGVRSTRQLGKYQLVKRDMTHVLFRNVEESKVDKIIDDSKVYRGPKVAHPELEGRKRAQKVAIKATELKLPNRMTDPYFSPKGVTERTSYDRQDYQWRNVGKQIRIKTLKMGKARKSLEHGDVIGVRYLTVAKGGYIIMPNQERVNIPTEIYKEIVENSRILSRGEQRSGVINMLDIKDTVLAERPEGRRATINRKRKAGGAMEGLKRRLANDPLLGDDEHDDFEDDTDHEAELLRDMLSPGSVVTISRARDKKVLVYRMKVDEKKNQMTLWFLGFDSSTDKPNTEDVMFTKLDSRTRVSDVKARLRPEGHFQTNRLKRITGVELSDAKSISLMR